jgi:hypothetical protein
MQDVIAIELRAVDGAVLTFRLTGSTTRETYFVVSVKNSWLAASADASTYVSGSPGTLFGDLAKNWRGWEGEKSWSDLEGRVVLTATADLKGHVDVKVLLKGSYFQDRAEVHLMFEAGMLENIGRQVDALFDRHAP